MPIKYPLYDVEYGVLLKYEDILRSRYAIITAPDGLIIGIYGPFLRDESDQNIVNAIHAKEVFQKHYVINGESYKCYGNMDYTTNDPILAEYNSTETRLDPNKKVINNSMKNVRINFTGVLRKLMMSYFGAPSKEKLEKGLTNIQRTFFLACLLYNFRICIQKTSASSEKCQCEPPKFLNYVATCA